MKTAAVGFRHKALAAAVMVLGFVLGIAVPMARADIDGLTGTSFTLTAKSGHLSTAEGNSLYFWGYADGTTGPAQYPGPTLIVNQGDTVTVTFWNELPVPCSIVFPGQEVAAAGGTTGLLTRDAMPSVSGTPAGPVVYTFTASQPGTYMYNSGTQMDLQIEMGLVGAVIVRPTGFDPLAPQAYDSADSAYDKEYLFLLSEMDALLHWEVESQVLATVPIAVDTTTRYPTYWFINGRTGSDIMLDANVAWLPAQPQSCMPMFAPGEKVLMRYIGGGRDSHPFHHHGNHSLLIAQDGRLLSSGPGAGADLARQQFTVRSTPGSTMDSIFLWTGQGLGWDVYGHTPQQVAMDDIDNQPLGWSTGGAKGPEDIDTNQNGIFETSLMPSEDPNDHGKPLPTTLPPQQDLTNGLMFSGSPFLGQVGALPPGEGGFNPGGFSYMWHSHAEKEITDFNIFPGGMMTMAMVMVMPMPMPMPMPGM